MASFGYKINKQKTVIKTNFYEKYTFRNKVAELLNLLRIFNNPPFTSSIPKEPANFETLSVTLQIGKIYLQSVTKIMGKAAIRTNSCFCPLPPVNNVEKQ